MKVFTEKIIGVRLLGPAPREIEAAFLRRFLIGEDPALTCTALETLQTGGGLARLQELTVGVAYAAPHPYRALDLLRHFREGAR
jgi:hypothetical protein